MASDDRSNIEEHFTADEELEDEEKIWEEQLKWEDMREEHALRACLEPGM